MQVARDVERNAARQSERVGGILRKNAAAMLQLIARLSGADAVREVVATIKRERARRRGPTTRDRAWHAAANDTGS
jgi:hypothetical protein